MTKYRALSWMALSQNTQSLEYDDSSDFEYYHLLLLKLFRIMPVGRLQSKCYDCVSRADSKTPEYHLNSIASLKGFWMNCGLALRGLGRYCGKAQIASDNNRRR